MMTTYFFPDCRLDVSYAGESHTLFCPSGCLLKRIPRPVDDTPTARSFGYGADKTRFRREHDVLLHTLATLQGRGCSPMLWALSHEDDALSLLPEASEEDEIAAHVHRWLNLDVWNPALETLLFFGWEKRELRDFLRAVLEGEITRIEMPVFALAA